jgi:hypothetical protein
MNLDEDGALGAVDVDELAVGRSPEFWWLRPIARGETAAGLLLAAGLTAPTEQLGLAVEAIDEHLLSGVGFAEISHGVYRDCLLHHTNSAGALRPNWLLPQSIDGLIV